MLSDEVEDLGSANGHGPVDPCLTDEDIPDNWGAGGAVDSGSATCAVGVLGRFAFNHCPTSCSTQRRSTSIRSAVGTPAAAIGASSWVPLTSLAAVLAVVRSNPFLRPE